MPSSTHAVKAIRKSGHPTLQVLGLWRPITKSCTSHQKLGFAVLGSRCADTCMRTGCIQHTLSRGRSPFLSWVARSRVVSIALDSRLSFIMPVTLEIQTATGQDSPCLGMEKGIQVL